MGVFNIAQTKTKEEQKKIIVSIYPDEIETAKETLSIDELTSRTVREAMGLPQTHSKTGAKSKLIKQIRDMSKEEAEEALKESEDNE